MTQDASGTDMPPATDAADAAETPDAANGSPAAENSRNSGDSGGADAPLLRTRDREVGLTDLLNIHRLLEMRQTFREITGLVIDVYDDQDQPLNALDVQADPQAADDAGGRGSTPVADDGGRRWRFEAPIEIGGVRMGSIVLERPDPAAELERDRTSTIARFAQAHHLDTRELAGFADACSPNRPIDPAALGRLFNQWAAGIVRACAQELELRQRIDEQAALYHLSTMLSTRHDLQAMLDSACESVADVMGVKAVSIRLLDETRTMLQTAAAHNISPAYLAKGPTIVSRSDLLRRGLTEELVYVPDMTAHPDIVYREDAAREGLVSMLSAPLSFSGRPLGLIRLYTDAPRQFSSFERNLLRAVGQLLATAIQNRQLDEERRTAAGVQRQLELAADVQRRMLPDAMPVVPGLDIAARYVPSLDISGDFFDFFRLNDHLGVTIGDVVGHGIAAGLLMASVRASLRAFAQELYDLDEVIARVNAALCEDTKPDEFASVFYGVFDPQSRRLTYCNAGHEPPILLRDGAISYLSAGGMLVGVDSQQVYQRQIVQLQPGDALLIYTDGLTEAFNFNMKKFGRQRIIQAFRESIDLAADAAVNHILWRMRCFTGLHRAKDDITVVLLRILGDGDARVDVGPSADSATGDRRTT